MMSPRFKHDILLFNGQQQLLLMDDHTLPQFETEAHYWQHCEPVNQAVKAHYDLDVMTIRCVNVDFGETENHYRYHLQWLDGIPSSGQWVDIHMLNPELQALITAIQHSSPNQPDWYSPDWYTQLKSHFSDARLEQVRAWERSTIWRVKRNGQIAYLKAIPDMFCYERPLTQWLAQHFPEHIVMSQAIADNMMLTPAYTGQALDSKMPLSVWERVLTIYAELQIATLNQLDDLHQLGVPMRDMAWIAQTLPHILNDTSLLKIGWNPLRADEISQLQGLMPQLQSHMGCLEDVKSLEHGDFWQGQVFVGDHHTITLTDFSDAGITHPFFSLVFLLFGIEQTLSHETDVISRLSNAYFKPFRQHFSNTKIEEMYQSARLISPLYSACRYYADILPMMAYTWEQENMIAFNLRLVLDTAKSMKLV